MTSDVSPYCERAALVEAIFDKCTHANVRHAILYAPLGLLVLWRLALFGMRC